MQEVEFINDLRHNYLTLCYRSTENSFALRMLTENITEGFLKVELRRLNEQSFLYYDISGMQSMEIMYTEKTIDRKAFQEFMWSLHEVIEQSGELFLSGNGICLDPSMLFWSLEKQRWEFLYIPERETYDEADIQKEKQKLAEFLVMRVDYEDKELSETIYRFYEEVCAGRIYPEAFLERERKQETEIAEEEIMEEREAGETSRIEDWPEMEKEDEKKRSEVSGRQKWIRNILLFLLAVVIVMTVLVSNYMQNVIVPGAAGAVALTVLLLFVQRKCQRNGGEKEELIKTENWAEEKGWQEEAVPEEAISSEEKTVYMDIQKEQERKLYGVGKFRQQKIVLNRLPCMIGKDKALVNHTVSDSSVSRIHARFFMEEGCLCMQDLNSTNGTYHNGMRLKPHEKVVLELDDEIGFGRTQFVYR